VPAQNSILEMAGVGFWDGSSNVRFGSLADIASRLRHVRFTSKSGHHRTLRHVRYVPKADMPPLFHVHLLKSKLSPFLSQN
jgi:hypothetical protein